MFNNDFIYGGIEYRQKDIRYPRPVEYFLDARTKNLNYTDQEVKVVSIILEPLRILEKKESQWVHLNKYNI
jgi:hypothetical protein